ncbi:MAG: cytochrome c biogenesis protein CcsA [bacterium]|nr:cytochrome c biogenesis protein CcsA [bacterium]
MEKFLFRNKVFEAILFILTFLSVLYANYLIFLVVPNERVMGPVQRIFYFHVGCAIATYFSVAILLMSALGHFSNKHFLWDILGKVAGEVALVFCLIVMITGMIWGHSAWNTWFRWEPRLVTFLILLLILLGLNLLRSFGDKDKIPNQAAVFSILAAINVPLVVFSVKILPKAAQLHPQVVQDRGLKDPSFVHAMIVSMIAMILLQFLLTWVAGKIELKKIERELNLT